jgi:hypothetical protein
LTTTSPEANLRAQSQGPSGCSQPPEKACAPSPASLAPGELAGARHLEYTGLGYLVANRRDWSVAEPTRSGDYSGPCERVLAGRTAYIEDPVNGPRLVSNRGLRARPLADRATTPGAASASAVHRPAVFGKPMPVARLARGPGAQTCFPLPRPRNPLPPSLSLHPTREVRR